MLYIKNNTDNNIKIRTVISGLETTILFPKSVVTAIDETLDTAFRTCEAYLKLFTEGTLSYTVRPAEKYKDDFSKYLKAFEVRASGDGNILKLTFDTALAGEEIFLEYAVDGGELNSVSGVLTESGVKEINLPSIDNYVEFRVHNNFEEDFPFMYSDRIRVYVE